MMRKRIAQMITAILLCIASLPILAENIFTVRSAMNFEQSMTAVKASIEAHGYSVAHVQRCDGGLHKFDYATDPYRVIFFGKFDEVRQLSSRYPTLIPFLPLKMAVFAEGDETIISVINLAALAQFYDDSDLRIQFKRWENDLRSILSDMQK